MNCVSYTRVTACAYEAPAIERQNEIIKAFADEHGLKILKKYSDRKNDPKADTAFQQLSNDGIARKFDCAIFCSMYSFGPTTYVGYDLLSKTFTPCGIQFAVVEDNYVSWEHTAEEIQNYLKTRYKDYSQYIHRLDIWKANKNRSVNKYGYITKPNNAGYEIDEYAAEIVKEIFARTLKGEMPTPITKDLIRRNISSPMQRFAELNGEEKTDKKGWTAQWVKNILKTVYYTGKYTRNIEGKIEEHECPVIIPQEDFETVQNIFKQREHKEPSRKRLVNPFLGKLYDFDTDLPLTLAVNKYHDRYEYQPRFIDKNKMQYENKKWKFENVYDQAIAVLNAEREKAENTLSIMMSEHGQQVISDIIGQAINRRQLLFEKMLDYADALLPESITEAGLEEFNKLDKEFNEATAEIEKLELIYSKENPWIKKFVFDMPSEEVEMKEFGTFFSKVWSHKFESLEFLIADTEWRDLLPEDWR